MRRLGRRRARRVLFAFDGGSGGWPGVGAELFRSEPDFRASLEATCPIVAEHLGFDALAAFSVPLAGPYAKHQEIALLGVIQLAICDLLRSVDVEPDAALAISLGEAGAAYAAGALTRADAAAVVCALASGATVAPVDHRLFVVAASIAQTGRICRSAPAPLVFVGTGAPGIALLLSDAGDVAANREHLARVSEIVAEHASTYPYHSMLAPDYRKAMDGPLRHIRPGVARLPLFSSVAGRDIASDARFDAAHWRWLIGHPFLYAEAATAALEAGYDLVVRIGVSPLPWLEATARQLGRRVELVDTLRRDEPAGATWRRARRRVRGLPRRPAAPDRTAQTLELRDPEFLRDPWPTFAALRAAGDVHHLPREDAWLVVGHDLVASVLRRPDEFSSRIVREADFVLVGADPPAHGQARRAVAPLFARSAEESIVDDVRSVAEEVLRDLAAATEFDAVSELAVPVAERAMARWLGVDDADVPRFRASLHASPDASPMQAAGAALRGLESAAPVRAALAARAELDEAALESLQGLLVIAGTVTTERLLTWALVLVDRHRHMCPVLHADPGQLEAFLDEVLRLYPPELLLHRSATRDVHLGDATIPAGAAVHLALGAANRDPSRFPDPDRLVLGRPQAHLAFGAGPHRCPGARFARLQVAVTLDAVLELMPDFEVVQPGCALRVAPGASSPKLAELMVAPAPWVAASASR